MQKKLMEVLDLKRFRKDNKLTQGDVSNATGIDQARISKYESGKDATEFITEKLLESYPDLKEYIIDSYNQPVFNKESVSLDKQLITLKAKLQEYESLKESMERMVEILSSENKYLKELNSKLVDKITSVVTKSS